MAWTPTYENRLAIWFKPGAGIHFNDDGLRHFCRLCRAGKTADEIADLMGIWKVHARHRYQQWLDGLLDEWDF